jgi:MATE family multidrug resistance protein
MPCPHRLWLLRIVGDIAMPLQPLTRRSILAQAWPIMLGQVTIPLVGVVDTFVIGRTGDAAALAAVALGTTIVNFLVWSFGFLRMGMTGLAAQAHGAGDARAVETLLLRGLLVGTGIGLALMALSTVLTSGALALFAASPALDRVAESFMTARLLSAPATLGMYAINGWLLGLGKTRPALLLQIVLNLANITLDCWFVWGLAMGARGVGLGTALAEWIAFALGLAMTARLLKPGVIGRIAGEWRLIIEAQALRRLVAVNADIMIRTMALLMLFAWFTNAGARLGTVQLAANQLLLQFVAVAAFVLDGFCFTTEARVGQAIGARSPASMRRAIRLTSEFALGASILFAITIFPLGPAIIAAMTPDPPIRAAAGAMLGFATLALVIGVPAWLLDGVFIGATAARALRNAAVVATALYIASDIALRPWGAAGMWSAFLLGYVYRAAALGWYFPGLMRGIARESLAPTASAP